MTVSAQRFENAGRFIVLTCKIEPDVETCGYVATCPALGVASQGDTLEEAENNIRDAVCLYLTVTEEDGELEGIIQDRGLRVAFMESPFEEIVRTAAGSQIIEAFPVSKAA